MLFHLQFVICNVLFMSFTNVYWAHNKKKTTGLDVWIYKSVETGKKWIQVEVTWTDFLVRSTKSFLSWSSLSPSLNFPGFDSTMPEPVKDPPTKWLNQCYISYKSDTWYLKQTLWRISQMQRWHQNQMWRLIHTWMFRWPLSRDSFGMTAVQLHLLLEGLVLWCWPGIALNFRYSDNLLTPWIHFTLINPSPSVMTKTPQEVQAFNKSLPSLLFHQQCFLICS